MPSVDDRFGEVVVAGVEGDGFAQAEVLDGDGAAVDGGEGAVAAFGGVPDGAADGRGAVFAGGAEAAVVIGGVQGL